MQTRDAVVPHVSRGGRGRGVGAAVYDAQDVKQFRQQNKQCYDTTALRRRACTKGTPCFAQIALTRGCARWSSCKRGCHERGGSARRRRVGRGVDT